MILVALVVWVKLADDLDQGCCHPQDFVLSYSLDYNSWQVFDEESFQLKSCVKGH